MREVVGLAQTASLKNYLPIAHNSQKKDSLKAVFFRESAGASILSRYAQTIKELCSFVNLHSHDTHRNYIVYTFVDLFIAQIGYE